MRYLFDFHRDDLAHLKAATGKSADELSADKVFMASYRRCLSWYHGMGQEGPLGPLLLTMILNQTRRFQSAYERREPWHDAEEAVDWMKVEQGQMVEVVVDEANGTTELGVFASCLGDGQLCVRLKSRAAGSLHPQRLVRLATGAAPGVNPQGFVASDEDDREPTGQEAVLQQIDETAAKQEKASKELAKQDAQSADPEPPATELTGPDLSAATAAADAALARARLAGETYDDMTDADVAAAQVPDHQTADLEDDGQPPPRESPWLWAESGHRAVVEHNGDILDAEYVGIANNANPDDLMLDFWLIELEKPLCVSEHKAKPKTAIPVPDPAGA